MTPRLRYLPAESQREYRVGAAAGLICSLTTTESSASSIMQLPQRPLQKALQHHKTTRERKRERGRGRAWSQKANSWHRSVRKHLCLFENTLSAAVTDKFHVLSTGYRSQIPFAHLGHARNAKAYHFLVLYHLRKMLYLFRRAKQTARLWKCFSNIKVEIWADRFRLRLSSPQKTQQSEKKSTVVQVCPLRRYYFFKLMTQFSQKLLPIILNARQSFSRGADSVFK